MKYTLTTYMDGKNTSVSHSDSFRFLLICAADAITETTHDEYEITNENGDVVAYAYTEDSPKAIEANNEREQSRKEMRGDSMRDIAKELQAEALAEGQSQRRLGA
jgi:outer membrane lipopolysaccharide assembly protein LptE/RlpB